MDERCSEYNLTNVISNPEMSSADYLVAFSGQTESYCVGMVDMVNSTKMAATLGNARISALLPNISKFHVKDFEQIWGFCSKKCWGLSSVLFSRILKNK